MCTIRGVSLAGHDVGPSGRPGRIVVEAEAESCGAVNVTVRAGGASGPMVHEERGLAIGPADAAGVAPVRLEFRVLATHDIACGRAIWIRVECADDAACYWEGLLTLDCPGVDLPEVPEIPVDPPEEAPDTTVIDPTIPPGRVPPGPIRLPSPLCRAARLVFGMAAALVVATLVALLCPLLAAGAAFILPYLLIALAVALGLVLLLCPRNRCAWLRLLCWSMKWGTVMAGAVSITCVVANGIAAILVVLATAGCGALTGILVLWLNAWGCAEPEARRRP